MLGKENRSCLKPAVIAAAIVLGFAGAAQAATRAQPDMPPIPQVPYDPQNCEVQPTLRCLPPGVAQTETKRTKAQKDFDKKLEFCRDC